MAIQMRRGLRKDFDPNKMLPGEWAVSIDSVTSNQIVWMCFAAGVCKRMGTYEDFQQMVGEIAGEIKEDYISDFDAIKKEIISIANEVDSDKNEVLVCRDSIVNTYLPQIRELAENAAKSESNAEISANDAEDSAIMSKSYAIGGTNTRGNEDFDNSRYYYQQTKQISQGINGIIPMGTVKFANLPTTDIVNNAMYNISDAFTSDSRFNDGGGIYYGAGNNVIWTAEGKWDVTASSNVTGIKGEAENTYRQGNVNITAENIGLGNVKDTYGNTDISAIGDGTVTGAINTIYDNTNVYDKKLYTTTMLDDGTFNGGMVVKGQIKTWAEAAGKGIYDLGDSVNVLSANLGDLEEQLNESKFVKIFTGGGDYVSGTTVTLNKALSTYGNYRNIYIVLGRGESNLTAYGIIPKFMLSENTNLSVPLLMAKALGYISIIPSQHITDTTMTIGWADKDYVLKYIYLEI